MLAAIGRGFAWVGAKLGASTGGAARQTAHRPADGGAAVSEPKFVAGGEWTPLHLRNALRITDSAGDLRYIAELCDQLLGDDRVSAAFLTRIGGLLGSDLTFERASFGNGRKRNRALKAIEAGEDWWEIFPEDEFGRLMMWGLLAGVGFAKLHWENDPEHGNRLLPRIEVWHPRWFRWDHKTKSWWVWTAEQKWVQIAAGDGEWIIYTPFGKSRPWAFGLWRGLSALWLLKLYALRDWGRYSETHGIPAWVTSGEPNDKKRQQLAELFGDLARNPSVALPPGVTAELIEAKADTWETFHSQIQLANNGYAVAVVGGNLNLEVDKNQQTGATAQTMVRIDFKRRDMQSASTLAHDQVLVWWAAWNFGEARLAPWPVWNVEPAEDQSLTATKWYTVANALASFRAAGYVVDIAETAERFDIPLTALTEPAKDSLSDPQQHDNQPADGQTDPNAQDAPQDPQNGAS